MIGENEGVFFGRVILHRPHGKIDQRLWRATVDLAQVVQLFRTNRRQIAILLNQKALGAGPIAIAIKCTIITIQLRDHGHRLG